MFIIVDDGNDTFSASRCTVRSLKEEEKRKGLRVLTCVEGNIFILQLYDLAACMHRHFYRRGVS